ncbi:hypothetical protein KCU93_g9817, partial [Aureobasidium melanogenum]
MSINAVQEGVSAIVSDSSDESTGCSVADENNIQKRLLSMAMHSCNQFLRLVPAAQNEDQTMSPLPRSSRLTQTTCSSALSFNHSRYGPFWVDRPIVISVETKHEGENIQQAYVQLAVWASAHMNFLCQVLADAASVTASKVAAGIILPPLPLLIAQGSQWSFLFASRQADGTIRIHAVIDFGDGSTRNGVYKVISVLRLLINWLEVSIAPGLKRIPWSTYGWLLKHS